MNLLNFFEAAGNVASALIGAGAFVLACITFVQTKNVRTTKNTVGLNEKFMLYQCATCVLLGMTSLWGILAGSMTQWYVIDGVLIFINVCLFASNFYCYKTKQANVAAARKAGMSEGEHYEKVILPSLKLAPKS